MKLKNLDWQIFLIIALFLSPSHAYARGEGEFITTIFIAIIIIIVIFLIFREVFCWYWKINERIALLREIRSTLNTISRTGINNLELIKHRTKDESNKGDSNETKFIVCPACKTKNRASRNTCYNCEVLFSENQTPKKSNLEGKDIEKSEKVLMPEDKLIDLIHKTYMDGNYKECKNYLLMIIEGYPESDYQDFAKKRLAEIKDKFTL